MHEWGIAKNIVDKISAAVKAERMTKAKKAEIHLGKGLGISKEEFMNCLEVTAKNDIICGQCAFEVTMNDSSLASIESIEAEENNL